MVTKKIRYKNAQTWEQKDKKLHKSPDRTNKKTKKKRKLRRKYRLKPEVKLYLTIFTFCFLFVVSSFTFLFKIRNLSVNNCEKYSQEEIIDSSGIRLGDNLLLVNKDKAEKNICDKFSYIEKAKITKKIPSSVEIDIKLETPDFFIENNGEYFLISKNSKVLEISNEKFNELIQIKGLELYDLNKNNIIMYKNGQDKSTFKELYHAVQNIFNNQINSIDMSDTNNIILEYNEKINIIIGDISDINYKLSTAKEILENKVDKKISGNVDVSKVASDNTSYFTPK